MSEPEHRDRGSLDTRVVFEPRTYGPDAPDSFFRDLGFAAEDRQARGRLDRHAEEVRHEIRRHSPEGRRAVGELLQHHRASYPDATTAQAQAAEQEIRAGTSATIQGFVTPQWIISEFAVSRSTQRTFADQCRRLPMPGVGLTIHVPRFTAGASAGAVSEGTAVSEADPTGADNLENIQTISAQVVISQQLSDRSRNMPDGPSFDLILYAQLRDDYDQSLNNYALGKAMGAGAHVAGQATFGLDKFYQDLALGREKLQDTDGVRLQASHLFTTPDLYGYITRQLDGSNRPFIVPGYAPGRPLFATEEVHDGWDQFTGTVLPGVLMWFVDATIPPAGSNTQLVVCRTDKILLWEAEPVVRAFPETLADKLQVVVQLYSYVACVPQYPGATATITSNAYTTSLV